MSEPVRLTGVAIRTIDESHHELWRVGPNGSELVGTYATFAEAAAASDDSE
jgi:hypothetical protein